jgi:hypothetical protein
MSDPQIAVSSTSTSASVGDSICGSATLSWRIC